MKETKVDLVQAIKAVENISYLLSESFKIWFDEASRVMTRCWESYTTTESYKKQKKYKRRVANREKLYQKRVQKYGKF